MIQNELHVEGAVRAQCGNGLLRIEYLHLAVRLDVAGGDDALAGGLNIYGLGRIGVKTGNDALDVQNYLRHVFLHAGNSGKLMLHAGDLYAGDSRAGKRRQEDSAQGVAKRCAVAALKGLDNILAV